jgi:hypothetical protein
MYEDVDRIHEDRSQRGATRRQEQAATDISRVIHKDNA